MLNLFLILVIIVFMIPQPLLKTIKKIWPVLTSCLILAFVVLAVQKMENNDANNTVIVKALDKKNQDSGGEEIWLMSAIVDGEKVSLKDYFGTEWIEKDGALIWRSYDQKEDMPDSISAHFEPGQRVQLEFQSNRWRGVAQISCKGEMRELDFYSDTDKTDILITYEIELPEAPARIEYHITKSGILFAGLTTLLLLNMLYTLFYYWRKNHSPFVLLNLSEREIWFDVLKVISSFMIVLIHSSGTVYNDTFEQGTEAWITMLWVNAIPRFAVPCFLMITGALLLDRLYDYDGALWHKIVRILIPLCVWSLLYVIVRNLLWHGNENIIEEFLKIPFKHQDGSLWYAYQLIWLYLGMPFWQVLYRYLTKRMRWCFVVFSLVVPGILTMLGELSLLAVPEYLPFASINVMVCYVGVLFLGKLLYEYATGNASGVNFVQGILLILCGLGMMIGASIYVSFAKSQATSMFFSEVRLPSIIYASGVFLLFGSLRIFLRKLPMILKRIICELSKVSLGVFLSHCLLIWVLPDMTIGGIYISRDSGSIYQLLLCVTVYYGIAAVGSLLLSSLPGLKRLVL